MARDLEAVGGVNALHRLFAIGCCLGALACALVSGLALGGVFSLVLDILTHFAPIYLAAAAAALLVAPFLPRPERWFTAVFALIGLAASLALIVPEYLRSAGPQATAGSVATLKLIQFNAYGGSDRALAWILEQNPDIVVIEEGGPFDTQVEKAGGYYLTCDGCAAVILSKTPPISSNAVKIHWNLPVALRESHPNDAAATFASDQGPFTVVGVHRPWPRYVSAYKDAARKLQALVAPFDHESMIVSGDFNSTPWSFQRRDEDRKLGVVRRTRALFSWPAEEISHNHLPAYFPILPIDHVYAGRGWSTVSVRRGPKLGSDHYPVVVELVRNPHS